MTVAVSMVVCALTLTAVLSGMAQMVDATAVTAGIAAVVADVADAGMYQTSWIPQSLPPTDWADFSVQSVDSSTTATLRVGADFDAADNPILLSYCQPWYISMLNDNITNAAILNAAGGLRILDINDGSGLQWLILPSVPTLQTITFIINVDCFDNDTLPIVINSTYTLVYIVDPVETVNISIPSITTVVGDTASRSIIITCGGGSGSHLLYNSTDTESLLVGNSSSYSFTVSSSISVTYSWPFTCWNALASPKSTATKSFVFNVNGCRTLPTGTLSYCEGTVPYPIDSRIDYTEADNRARALYENDVYFHWNATGLLPPPNVTSVYDNATGTYSNVTDTVVTISSNCLAMRRRWYCAQQFPYCQQSTWANYQMGPCRGICSMVIHEIRCGSAYDNYPRCDQVIGRVTAFPTIQPNTATGYNAITGYTEFNITVRSYSEGLCAAAHHMTSLPSMITLIMMTITTTIASLVMIR